MSTRPRVIGIRLPDEKWSRMKVVWDECKKLGIDPPKEVYDFFEGENPEPEGVEVDIEGHGCCQSMDESKYNNSGFIIDVRNLPKDVALLKFWAYF